VSFLKKRKADKVAKLTAKVAELEGKNATLTRELFLYRLKDGKVKTPARARRPMRKMQGKKMPPGGPPR